MFTVYHSNKIDLLKTLVATIMTSSPLRDPFKSEFILVQSTGMEQWMQIELAEKFGISANIEFQIPEKFIFKMFTRMFTNITNESMLAKQVMIWKIISILPNMCCKHEEFRFISHYLQDDYDKRKCFKLAVLLSDLFDQYMVYRPDWLESWLHGKLLDGLGAAQLWQAPLLRELIITNNKKINTDDNIYHRANIYQHFIHTLAKSTKRPIGFPDRCFVFGISAMPPIYLQVLHALGRYIHVHLFFTNPCRYYWGDIYDCTFLSILQRIQDKKNVDAANTHEEQKLVVNPLLASWGKLGRDNLYLLSQLEEVQEVDAFVKLDGDCLLSLLQRDILELEDHTFNMSCDKLEKNIIRRKLQPEDRSFSLHVCYSMQREIEVLHDSLLTMMTNDTSLVPREIIVMVADIDRYTPLIQAVFCSAAAAGRYLPFSISDRRVRYIHPVLPALLSLLELPRSRFTIEHVLTLLEIPAIANRFEINEEMLKLLRNLLAKSVICWELDDENLHTLKDNYYNDNTCKLGNILLGYAKKNINNSCVSEIIVNLCYFVNILRKWRSYLTEPRLIADWLCCIRNIINDFFRPDVETEAALSILEKHWLQILQYGLDAEYDQLVSITLLHDELTASLDHERVNPHFLAGDINFCTIMPMRSIPFKVICLLGMNDGIYPRYLPSFSFDLIAAQHKNRRGDLSRHDDDRYMFLEALLSAQQRLYISFIGRDIQDNTTCYPSCLVRELTEYIAQSFYLPGYEHADADINAARIREHLLQWHSRMPFDPENFIYGSEKQSFCAEWIPAAAASKGSRKQQNDNFIQTLDISPVRTLSLDELKIFYSHPVRTWFQKRLYICFSQEKSVDLEFEEHFIIDSLTRYQLNDMLVKALIYLQDIDLLFIKFRASGKLPYGAFGELYWNKQCKNMNKLAEKVREMLLPERKNMVVELALGDIKISGLLMQVQADGILRWRPGHLSMKDGLMLWIDHLVYCAIGGKGDSMMFGLRGKWHFAPLTVEQAKVYLMSLVSGYCHGMKKPIFLLNRSGCSWLKKCFDRKLHRIDWHESSQLQARSKLLHTLQGDDYVRGEVEDPYLKRLMLQLNDMHIDAIIQATQCYLLPPFKFNLAKKIDIDD